MGYHSHTHAHTHTHTHEDLDQGSERRGERRGPFPRGPGRTQAWRETFHREWAASQRRQRTYVGRGLRDPIYPRCCFCSWENRGPEVGRDSPTARGPAMQVTPQAQAAAAGPDGERGLGRSSLYSPSPRSALLTRGSSAKLTVSFPLSRSSGLPGSLPDPSPTHATPSARSSPLQAGNLSLALPGTPSLAEPAQPSPCPCTPSPLTPAVLARVTPLEGLPGSAATSRLLVSARADGTARPQSRRPRALLHGAPPTSLGSGGTKGPCGECSS